MKFERNCKTCEFNFSGTCAEHMGIYKYGQKIKNDSKECTAWGSSLEYYKKLTEESEWHIREPYNERRIDYEKFIELLEKDSKGETIEVNIYDAIRNIYGIDALQIAKLLEVTVGVIGYAYKHGTISKRINEFSEKLCIPAKYFRKCTNKDFSEIERCKIKFEKGLYYQNYLKNMNEIKYKGIHIQEVIISVGYNNGNQRMSSVSELLKNIKSDLMPYADFEEERLEIVFRNLTFNRKDISKFLSIFDLVENKFSDIKIGLYFEKEIIESDEKLDEDSVDIFDFLNNKLDYMETTKKEFLDNIIYL